MSIFGPAWFTRQGDGIGNLPVCDTLWSSKSVMFWDTGENDDQWEDNPAYIPFSNNDIGDGQDLSDNNTRPRGFTHFLVPGNFKKASLRINKNTIGQSFKVYLGRDGPTGDGVWAGPPVRKELIFTVKLTTDPEYTPNLIYDGPDIELFSGHSWAYLFVLDEPVPSLPSAGRLRFTMANVIYFGAAGD